MEVRALSPNTPDSQALSSNTPDAHTDTWAEEAQVIDGVVSVVIDSVYQRFKGRGHE